jgi:ATP-dependent DNA ligase
MGPAATRRRWARTLLLGVYEDGALIPVGTGWTAQAAKAIRKSLAALEQNDCPFAGRIGDAGARRNPRSAASTGSSR